MSVQFGTCCFCGKDIEQNGPDSCRVIVETTQGKWQVWHCHGSCFRTRLVVPPDYPADFFEPAHF